MSAEVGSSEASIAASQAKMNSMQSADAPAPSRASRIAAWPIVRIVLGTIAVAAPVILTFWLVRATLDKPLRIMWPQVLAAALCVMGYRLYVRRIEKRLVPELSADGAWRELTQGVLGAAALLAATMSILFVTGTYRVTGLNDWTVILVPSAEMVLVAFVEELIFRGILFRITEKSLGSWFALGLTSLIFACSHLPNEGITALGVAVTAVAGLMFGAAYMATRRLWLTIGIHFGWNYVLGTITSVTVSGHASKGLLQGALTGPDWLTGAAYGLEASVPGLVAVSLATVFLIRLAQRRGNVILPHWKRKSQADF
jgi:uncharacterized protein